MSTEESHANKTVCPVHGAELPEQPFIQQGEIHFSAHHVGWIICGFFTIIAVGVSAWLIDKHLTNYTSKGQQRYIVRCLLLVPIYAIISTLSYILYDSYASPLILVRDSYESFALHAFFCLLLEYISHNVDEQKEAFREIKLEKWMIPLGCIRRKPSGLYFLQIMKWGVIQYAVLRPLCTVIALVLNWFGLYCETSWSPVWAYIYITIIVSTSVTVAMYCLIQLYIPIADRLKPYDPILKLISIKSVVFLTFWQATFLSVLASFKVVKDTPYMTAEEINIGFGALLETFEMMIFAFLHLKAFSYKPYVVRPLTGSSERTRTPRLRSFGHVLDFRDIARQFWAGCVYMWDRARGYEPDRNERHDHLQRALGQRRMLGGSGGKSQYRNLGKELDHHHEKSSARNDRMHRADHPRLQLQEADVGLLRHHGETLEEEVNSELRRLRIASEHDRRATAVKKGRAAKKKSSAHQRDMASSDPNPWIAAGRLDEQDEAVPADGRGVPTPAKRAFWRGLYDRVSNGGGHAYPALVPQLDHDDDEEEEMKVGRAPSWIQRVSFPPHGPPDLNDEPPLRGMVVTSRPPPPPPKPSAPTRADSFMRRVFTADVTSSEDGYARSREHSQEMLAMGGMAWGGAVKQVTSGGFGHPPSMIQSVVGPTSSRITSTPVVGSPPLSSYGSLQGDHDVPTPRPTGPSIRPATGPIMPTPLSPARFPGYTQEQQRRDSGRRSSAVPSASPTLDSPSTSDITARPSRSRRPRAAGEPPTSKHSRSSRVAPPSSAALSPPPTFSPLRQAAEDGRADPLDLSPPRSSPPWANRTR